MVRPKNMRNLRAWDPSRKCMNNIRGYVDNDKTIRIYNKIGGFSSYLKDQIIIIEGTGELDENKVEIFQGDKLETLVDNTNEIIKSIVVFKDASFFYVTEDEEGALYYLTQNDDIHTKITGSIYAKV